MLFSLSLTLFLMIACAVNFSNKKKKLKQLYLEHKARRAQRHLTRVLTAVKRHKCLEEKDEGNNSFYR